VSKHNEHTRRNAATTSTGAAGAAVAFEPAAERGNVVPVIDHNQIALLAYSYWEARGCPDGSPEEDWFRADGELRKKAVAAA